MRATSCLARVLTLLVVVLTSVTACASIPKRSDPEVVKQVDEGTAGNGGIPDPPAGIDPLDLVRNFVNAAAAPEQDYAAARKHLTDAAARSWKVPSEMLIVDQLDTFPVPEPPDTPDNVQLVRLKASKVGRLRSDQSFVPEKGAYEVVFEVERQPGGEWRIAGPPPRLVVSRTSFVDTYVPVSVYFLDHKHDGVVPDRRYVVGQPGSTLPARVIDLLLSGPSRGFRKAMDSALPPDAETVTNVSEASNGALEVNFRDLGALSPSARRLIAAQVVLSLQGVSNARVRLLETGTALLPGNKILRPADVAAFKSDNRVPRDVPPLAVASEKLVVLNQRARPVPGPAGSGEYTVKTAGLAADGSKLAAAVRTPEGGVRLRVGPYGAPMRALPVTGSFMSRPSWRTPTEVWTVVDGRRVVRAVRGNDGGWNVSSVDAAAFGRGEPITDLRLSRDGTRVAGVVGGRIVVAGVVGTGDNVALKHPRVLTGSPVDDSVIGVEWLSSDSLIAITESDSMPVVEVTVDGFKWIPYGSANLVSPTAVTVGPGHKVVVADRNGLWQAVDPKDLWQLLQTPVGGGSIPFYPG